MKTRRLKWLAACAALFCVAETTAWATTVSITMLEWQSQKIVDLGDKRYTWLSNDTGLDSTQLNFLENLTFNTHTISVNGETTAGDIHTLEYMVDVIGPYQAIYAVEIDSNKQGATGASAVVTKTVFATKTAMENGTPFLAQVISTNGTPGGPGLFKNSTKLYIRDVIDETGGGTVTGFSNTLYQTPVPEPSTWLLSAFAAGGLALVRYRKTNRSPADAPPA